MDITSDIDPKMRKIELVFRLSGKANQPAYEIANHLRRNDGGGVWWTGRRTRDGKVAEDLKVVATMVPADAKTVGLDLLVAAGPWETVATSDGRLAAGPLGAAVPGENAGNNVPSTAIAARFDPDKLDAQVIGIDADGGKHVVRGFDIRRGVDDAGANFRFQGLAPGQFKSFTLQTRPNNELIRLTDISLVPGQRTDARLTVPSANGTSDKAISTTKAAGEVPWGEATDGVQVRLRADKAQWKAGEVPKLLTDFRNTGQAKLRLVLAPEWWELELGGQWYRVTVANLGEVEVKPFGPQTAHENISLPLEDRWGWKSKEGNKPLVFGPGKHTVRAAFAVQPAKTGEGKPVRVVSNPVEIEILPADAKPATPTAESGWGEIGTAGLQMRLVILEQNDREPPLYPEAWLEVRNMRAQRIGLALANSTPRKVTPVHWKAGLHVEARLPDGTIRPYWCVEPGDEAYWQDVRKPDIVDPIEPGRTACFVVNLRQLMAKDGARLSDLQGACQLRPVLEVTPGEGAYWSGLARGGWVPVHIAKKPDSAGEAGAVIFTAGSDPPPAAPPSAKAAPRDEAIARGPAVDKRTAESPADREAATRASLAEKAAKPALAFRGLDLSSTPVVTKLTDIPDLWDAESGQLRKGVEQTRSIIAANENLALGHYAVVYYRPDKNVFYVMMDDTPLGSSGIPDQKYYGPFTGDPHQTLDLKPPLPEPAAGSPRPKLAFRDLDLTDAPMTTDIHKLPDVYDQTIPGFGAGVTFSPHLLEQGYSVLILYIADKDVFYVNCDSVWSRTEHFYGPFKGDPFKRFGLEAAVSKPVEFSVEESDPDLSGVWTGGNKEAFAREMALAEAAGNGPTKVAHLRKALQLASGGADRFRAEYELAVAIRGAVTDPERQKAEMAEATAMLIRFAARKDVMDYYSLYGADSPHDPELMIPKAAVMAAAEVNDPVEGKRLYLLALNWLKQIHERRVQEWQAEPKPPEPGPGFDGQMERSKWQGRVQAWEQRQQRAKEGKVLSPSETSLIPVAIGGFLERHEPAQRPAARERIAKEFAGTQIATDLGAGTPPAAPPADGPDSGDLDEADVPAWTSQPKTANGEIHLWTCRSCKRCRSVQMIEVLEAPGLAFQNFGQRIVGKEWKWKYRGKDHRTCQHEWQDGVSTGIAVSTGKVVLVRKGNVHGAFVLTAQSIQPETAKFIWRCGTDPTGGFNTKDPNVKWSNDPKPTEKPHGAPTIFFGPFEITWSGDQDGKGWIYYTKSPGDKLADDDLAICVTDERSLDDIRPRDKQWQYRRSPVDGMEVDAAPVKAVPTSPQAVVDSLVAAVSAIEKDYPELESFAKDVADFRKKFPAEKLNMRFSRNVKPYNEMRLTRPDDVGKNGIELIFQIQDESNPGWTTGTNPHIPLKALKKLVSFSLVLSPTPSAGLEQQLAAIIAEHRAMLVKLDKLAAHRAPSATPLKEVDKKATEPN